MLFRILKDKVLLEINEGNYAATIEDLFGYKPEDLPEELQKQKYISKDDLVNEVLPKAINYVRRLMEQQEATKPRSKLLFIEDGSVDVDVLMDDLSISNPEIKVIVYRQGSCAPILKDIKGGM